MCMCGIEYMFIERSRRESEFSPACIVARVGRVGPLPQMSVALQPKCARTGTWLAVTCICPAQTDCDVAQLCGPKGVQSCAHTHAHTHIYTKINTHTFSACPLWSKSCLKATVEL